MSTATFDFPIPLTERYRPTAIDDFIGIAEAKTQANAIIARPLPNSAYLFCGESGTGKTTMALAIAKAMDAQAHHIPARQASKESIDKTWESVHYSTWTGSGWHVVLIDEVDLWRADLQDMMLSIWDSMGTLTNTLFGDWTPSPPKVIWLCTTNCDHRKLKNSQNFETRFLSRLRIVPFSNYAMAGEITNYLKIIWKSETRNGDPDFTRIVKESRNNIRECLNELELLITRNDA